MINKYLDSVPYTLIEMKNKSNLKTIQFSFYLIIITAQV